MNSSRRGQRECSCIFGRRRAGVPPGHLRRPPLLVKSRAARPPQRDTREPTGGRASTSASGWKIICSQCRAATPVDAASKQWLCCRVATQTPWLPSSSSSSDFWRCVFTPLLCSYCAVCSVLSAASLWVWPLVLVWLLLHSWCLFAERLWCCKMFM